MLLIQADSFPFSLTGPLSYFYASCDANFRKVPASVRLMNISNSNLTARSPWRWIPPSILRKAFPNVIVMTVSVVLYKRLGLSNTDIALYNELALSSLGHQALWSPLVDMLRRSGSGSL